MIDQTKYAIIYCRVIKVLFSFQFLFFVCLFPKISICNFKLSTPLEHPRASRWLYMYRLNIKSSKEQYRLEKFPSD